MTNKRILPLLQCPKTKNPLEMSGDSLRVTGADVSYPIIRGVPIFSDEGSSVTVHPQDHLSNEISEAARRVVNETDGLVLNLSAGGSRVKSPNVVELEYSIFRYTDVVGDAHALPFKDCSFDACICMNAFEHYRDPKRVATELLRVLKPGATLFMHTAGLQPLHEPPHHYYNVTRFGLSEWLNGFEIEQIRVSENFNPAFALSWLISELERGVSWHQGPLDALRLRRARLGEVMKFWRDPGARNGKLWDVFQNLDPHTLDTCAAGWEAKARKPIK